VRCPKELNLNLIAGVLSDGLAAHCCASCQGAWISAGDYGAWQEKVLAADGEEPAGALEQLPIPSTFEVDYKASPYDSRAGLCPECGYYLVRGRVNLRTASFFVERCPACKGIWCDRNEWGVLETVGMSAYVPAIFSDSWQGRVRVLEAEAREKQATVDKLGMPLAEKIFELADLLEAHPNGDFGVAYLMRRFED
jgi:Zn-finger nucleic acid-binding protein